MSLTIWVGQHGTKCKIELDGKLMPEAISATIRLQAAEYTIVEIDRYVLEKAPALHGNPLERVKVDDEGKPVTETLEFGADVTPIEVINVPGVFAAEPYDVGDVDRELLIEISKGVGS